MTPASKTKPIASTTLSKPRCAGVQIVIAILLVGTIHGIGTECLEVGRVIAVEAGAREHAVMRRSPNYDECVVGSPVHVVQPVIVKAFLAVNCCSVRMG